MAVVLPQRPEVVEFSNRVKSLYSDLISSNIDGITVIHAFNVVRVVFQSVNRIAYSLHVFSNLQEEGVYADVSLKMNYMACNNLAGFEIPESVNSLDNLFDLITRIRDC
jgi:hypothetical protein